MTPAARKEVLVICSNKVVAEGKLHASMDEVMLGYTLPAEFSETTTSIFAPEGIRKIGTNTKEISMRYLSRLMLFSLVGIVLPMASRDDARLASNEER